MTAAHLLVVEDDPGIGANLERALESSGYRVTVLTTVAETLAVNDAPDLVLLDLGLPDGDGVSLARTLGERFPQLPIVMLTARTDEIDVLIGLSVGADDYVTKPFSARELVARVQTMLRRPRAGGAAARPVRRFGELEVDADARDARVAGAPLDLTPTEGDLLSVLSERPRLAFSRHQLIETIWGDVGTGDEHLVDVHIANLRRKLGDGPTLQRYIVTVRGVGYRMGQG